jgi:hypothetical protein
MIETSRELRTTLPETKLCPYCNERFGRPPKMGGIAWRLRVTCAREKCLKQQKALNGRKGGAATSEKRLTCAQAFAPQQDPQPAIDKTWRPLRDFAYNREARIRWLFPEVTHD